MTTRRDFLKTAGGGLVVVLVAPRLSSLASFGDAAELSHAPDTLDPKNTDQIAAWLHVDERGAVTVYTGKVEFGQGIRTSLAQHVAEELRVAPESIRLVMGDTELTPYDMGTFGSRTTPQMGVQLRRAAASAREVLIGLAADRWKVDRARLAAEHGRIVDATTKRSIGFGDLTKGRKLTETIRADVAPKPATEWTVAGTSLPKVGARDIVTGRHAYTSDMRLPGMLHGRVLRDPGSDTKIVAVEADKARAIRGAVVVQDGKFTGVAAPSLGLADRAIAALHPTYEGTSIQLPTWANVFEYLRRSAARSGSLAGGEGGRGGEPFVVGDVHRALAAAEHKLARTYTVAYIAHVPLEPRAAVAQWTRDAQGPKLTVWTGTQRPFAVRDELAQAFGLATDRVRVIVPDTGAGYGGKHTGECAVEAARLARAARKPVKLVWTREEEFRHAYFRPAGVIDVDAAVASDGTIQAWTFDNYNSGPAGIRPTYAIANQRVTYHPSDSPLRQGSYRGLAATANNFAREMHVDELAHLVSMDPLAFRLKNLDDDRLEAVLEAAAERFGWGKPLTHGGNGAGIACGFEKGGYVATCAEVAADRATGAVRITRAVTAFDCGAVVNPDGLHAQISGGMIQGIGGALFEAVEFAGGYIRNAHLAEYRVPRFSDIPALEIVLIDRKDRPSMGAGETPIIAIAPAAGAAIFEATGIRPRSLPMARNGLKAPTT